MTSIIQLSDRLAYNKYMRDYSRERYEQRMAELRERLGGKCAWCGSTKDLEFDHIDPATKEIQISQLMSVSKEAIEAELLKCQLLCSPCHEIKSLAERGQESARSQHGTLSSYRYCKCGLCKEAKRLSNAQHSLLRAQRRRSLDTPESLSGAASA